MDGEEKTRNQGTTRPRSSCQRREGEGERWVKCQMSLTLSSLPVNTYPLIAPYQQTLSSHSLITIYPIITSSINTSSQPTLLTSHPPSHYPPSHYPPSQPSGEKNPSRKGLHQMAKTAEAQQVHLLEGRVQTRGATRRDHHPRRSVEQRLPCCLL